ncbi:MAG TPA: hypothetical protein VF331_05800 [Polyangiales bacterium]
MYLSAQHVRSLEGAEGLNAFHFSHGAYIWEGLPPQGIPDQDPGMLVAQSITVTPPGNLVRAYLDIVTPDETPWNEIRPAFITFVSEAQGTPLPWIGVVGRCLFRLGMDRGVAAQWQRELADLYRATMAVRVGG